MVFFLERIAKLLYEQSGNDLRGHCLVFPSRRAGLYFLKYYAALLDKPAWTPLTMTIGDFFSGFSDLIVAENEILLFELFKVYRKLNPKAESFDEFYFWGDTLINDFDDVDKYLADDNVLFRNVQDFKNIDDQFGDISPEQSEIIKKFWKNFEPEKHTREKEGFKSIWKILPDLYDQFKKSLRTRNLAYEGMIYRDVAELCLKGKELAINWQCVHFVGFNALNNCEITVMKRLTGMGVAKFYWDYDNSYIKEGSYNSAGLFLKKNLKIFGNDMPDDWNYDTNISVSNNNFKHTIFETTSDIAQVKLIPELIGTLEEISPEDAHHTAVILADENLIVPLLSSLPEGNFDVNITMGYPLIMTVVYTLLKHLMELQRNSVKGDNTKYFQFRDVLEILRHQLVINILSDDEKRLQDGIISGKMIRIPQDYLVISESTSILFDRPEDPQSFSEYIRKVLLLVTGGIATDPDITDKMPGRLINEFIYTVLLSVNRLDSLVGSGEISFRNETYIRILDKILRGKTVPFTGEPLSGIQIMGFLETRALDFRNIIMLSVNEGILPSVSNGSSFIPFSLREAFGLPVINHQESIFAYHFYRLLHRAENISFIYNSDTTGLRTGEMSRFLIQMKYEKDKNPGIVSLTFEIAAPSSIGQVLEKEDRHLRSLVSMYSEREKGRMVSPSAINTWLNCRMRFYYRYVNRLKEPDIFTGEFDHAMFGQILHSVMKLVYADFVDSEISENDIEYLIKDEKNLKGKVELSVNEISKSNDPLHLDGRNIIMQDILMTYVVKILSVDRMLVPFSISGLEKTSFFRFSARSGDNTIDMKIGGIIDRIDKKDGKTRIVDYKTGSTSDRISSVGDLFEDDRKKELDGWLQTLLYCESVLSENPQTPSRPSIYNVRELSAENFSDILKIREGRKTELAVDDYRMIRTEFMEGLQRTINSIFSPDDPFRMTTDISKCSYCPYRSLCQR